MSRAVMIGLIASLGMACSAARVSDPAQIASAATKGGCTIEATKLCRNFFSTPTFVINGQKLDWQEAQQSWRPHETLTVTALLPSGDEIGTIECDIATEQKRVTRGRIISGPPVSAESLAYAKQQGLCTP